MSHGESELNPFDFRAGAEPVARHPVETDEAASRLHRLCGTAYPGERIPVERRRNPG
jgi:hypothetical protein